MKTFGMDAFRDLKTGIESATARYKVLRSPEDQDISLPQLTMNGFSVQTMSYPFVTMLVDPGDPPRLASVLYSYRPEFGKSSSWECRIDIVPDQRNSNLMYLSCGSENFTTIDDLVRWLLVPLIDPDFRPKTLS